jgi:tetratricopeptide (TPR) repeat protein
MCYFSSRSTPEEDYYFRKGTEAQDTGDCKEAVEYFTQAAEANDRNANYLYHLAYCLQEVAPDAGKEADEYHHRAMGYYRKVLAIDPLHHEAWYNLGYVQEELQEFSAAIASFTKALEVVPGDKDALVNLGNCHMSLNDFDASVAAYHEALALDPLCVMSHYNLASAHHAAAGCAIDDADAATHYAAAKFEFLEAIKLNGDYADAYFNLGICYQDERAFDQAKSMYAKAIALQPDMAEAVDALSELNKGTGDS